MKMTATRALAAFSLVALATVAHADSAGNLEMIDDDMKACIEKDGSNMGMQDCTRNAYDEADGVMNDVYQPFVSRLEDQGSDGAEFLSRLKAAQRKWVSFRDANCASMAALMLGGSGEALLEVSCLYDMTTKRTQDLSDLYSSQFPN